MEQLLVTRMTLYINKSQSIYVNTDLQESVFRLAAQTLDCWLQGPCQSLVFREELFG